MSKSFHEQIKYTIDEDKINRLVYPENNFDVISLRIKDKSK